MADEHPNSIYEYIDSKIQTLKQQQEEALLVTERQWGDMFINLIAQNVILSLAVFKISLTKEQYKILFEATNKAKNELSKSNIPYFGVALFRDWCNNLLKTYGIEINNFKSPYSQV